MTTADIDPGRARDVIETGRASLGIEFGSTNIKACLIGPDYTPLASGSHAWENEFVDGRWTYSLEAVWAGLQACYADLVTDVQRLYDVTPTSFRAIGISAMMHGYLAFDEAGDLLVPFRTWRNTSTGPAAVELTEALGFNIPQRWSIAHLYQAVLDEEPHIGRIAALNTLAGYVHQKLTGKTVLGVGDASGVFPIDPATGGYDQRMLAIVDPLIDARVPGLKLEKLLPEVLPAGAAAGDLTAEGAALLDPTGALKAGVPFCPPEGDAGTGMVATNSVARRTGNVSVGTSAFAMVVLEHPLEQVHEEIDVVTTPAGDAVAMVHCNNGANELSAWAGLFGRFAQARRRARGGPARRAPDGGARTGQLVHPGQLHAYAGLCGVLHPEPGDADPGRREGAGRQAARPRRALPHRGPRPADPGRGAGSPGRRRRDRGGGRPLGDGAPGGLPR